MAAIITSDLKIKTVKNLGWLIKHWQEVKSFEVKPHGVVCLRINGKLTEAIPELENSARGGCYDCVLVARLKNGDAYATAFSDAGVLLNWLHRSVFFGLKVDWFGVEITLEQNSAIHKKARGG